MTDRLVALARMHHGVTTTARAATVQVSRVELARRSRQGEFHRLRRDAYVLGEV